MGPSLRVFRGLLGHAVLVKSCAIETSAAAISRILAPIGGNFSPPDRIRGSFAQPFHRRIRRRFVYFDMLSIRVPTRQLRTDTRMLGDRSVSSWFALETIVWF